MKYKNILHQRKNRTGCQTQSGQAVMEALFLLPLVCACFILCFLFFHVHAQHLWMDHQLYQSLICLAKGKKQINCKTRMETKIKTFLWMGKLKDIQFYKGKKEYRGFFIWETGFWRIRFAKKIHLGKGALL